MPRDVEQFPGAFVVSALIVFGIFLPLLVPPAPPLPLLPSPLAIERAHFLSANAPYGRQA